MAVTEKSKIVEQKNRAKIGRYSLGRKVAEVSALSSEKVTKYEFLIGDYVLSQNGLLKKAVKLSSLSIYNQVFNKKNKLGFLESGIND